MHTKKTIATGEVFLTNNSGNGFKFFPPDPFNALPVGAKVEIVIEVECESWELRWCEADRWRLIQYEDYDSATKYYAIEKRARNNVRLFGIDSNGMPILLDSYTKDEES